jgi:AraC-like DNA-binding protein
MPLDVPFSRVWPLNPFLHFLEELGAPAETYLSRAHISPHLIDDDLAAIPYSCVLDFIDRASRGEGIDHFGARAGQLARPETMGNLCLLMAASRNLHEYFFLGRRFARSVTSHCDYRFFAEGDEVRFEYRELGGPRSLHGHLFAMMATINTIRSLVGEAWCPSDVVLPTSSVAGLADISDAFENVRARPTTEGSSFRFPRAFLTLPSPGEGGGLDVPADEALASLDAGTARHAVDRLARMLVLSGCAHVRTAAEVAHMSVRTFQRRMADCGLVFSEVVQEAKIAIAKRRLLEEGWPVNEIARSLGYSDPANFSRAFRRFHGISPQQLRQSKATIATTAGRPTRSISP